MSSRIFMSKGLKNTGLHHHWLYVNFKFTQTVNSSILVFEIEPIHQCLIWNFMIFLSKNKIFLYLSKPDVCVFSLYFLGILWSHGNSPMLTSPPTHSKVMILVFICSVNYSSKICPASQKLKVQFEYPFVDSHEILAKNLIILIFVSPF